MSQFKNTCAVCGAPIGISLLMCRAHWRAVPKDQQHAVISAYGRWQRHTGEPLDLVALIADYRNARDAAVASARGIASQATGDLL